MAILSLVLCVILCVVDTSSAAHRSPLPPTSTGLINVTLASRVPLYVVDEKYLSFTIDSGTFTEHLRGFNTSSVKLQNVARGLGKTFLRVGGTDADRIVFRDPVPGFGLITVQDFDDLYLFAKTVGWEYSFDLNILLRNGTQWNSTNARAVLDYAVSKGYVFNLELGNEPDFYVLKKNIGPAQIGHDFVAMRGLMSTYPTFKNVNLMGPSVTQGAAGSYLAQFLTVASTSIDVISVHHYYCSGSDLHPPEMLDPSWMDSAAGVVNRAKETIAKYSKGTQTLWLAETGLSYSRSAPDTSGYIAGFMWLDKLGISAVHGASLLAIQTFGNFMDALYNPTPEYWMSYLYKQLVGTRVLKLSSTENNHYFRIYAHCSLKHEGGIAFFYVNLYRSDTSFSIPEYSGQSYEMYSLTVGGNGSMSSSIVNLNGEPMSMDGDYFPLFEPVTSLKWPVIVPQLSYGFFVLPNTDFDACK